MNILSLFDGMSCAQIAINNLGIKNYKYYASEIDKYAIKVTQANYPETIQLGDVTKIKASDLPKIDLLIAGPPCQGFSFAGKQLNFNDTRSALFFEFVRILKEVKPKYFLLENVKMKQEYQDVISEHLGVKPIEINSALVSAQNRKRLYWCNFDINRIFPYNSQKFQDILESDYARIDKSYVLTATYFKKGAEATRQRSFKKSQRPVAWIDDKNTRWLTPIECERLQTVPDNYTNHVSNTQRYKMLGNGFTVKVIEHILKNILQK